MTYLTLKAHLHYFTIHITVRQTAEQLHQHVILIPTIMLSFLLLFLISITPAAASQSRRGEFHKGFNHLGFLQWRRGLHIGHRFVFVVDMEAVWFHVWASDCVLKMWTFLFWCWDRGQGNDCSGGGFEDNRHVQASTLSWSKCRK